MIICFVNALNRDQEFGAPEIVSYLMGWNEIVQSHHYVHIYWDSAMAALTLVYPNLVQCM